MPGILKVGMTERTPEARLSEANASDTWRPPTPYTIEFAKKVSNPSQKEKILHNLLEQYTDRINPRREFFRVSPEEVRKFFELMDGEMWAEPHEKEEKEEDGAPVVTNGVCIARKLRNKYKLSGYKCNLYMPKQCGEEIISGGMLCEDCHAIHEIYKNTGNPATGKTTHHITWNGLMTESPPVWSHMLGTVWANENRSS